MAIAASFAALVAASGAALAVTSADAGTAMKAVPAERKAEMEKHRQEFFKHMSDRMADRLEIKSSQQGAFQTYTAALQAAMTPPASHPDYKTDAAGIARMNADRAAEHARRLASIADATAKFQGVLSPDQRKTFDQMAAAFMHRHHGMRHGFGHEHGEDRGEEHGHGGFHWDHGGTDHHQEGGQHS